MNIKTHDEAIPVVPELHGPRERPVNSAKLREQLIKAGLLNPAKGRRS